MICTKTANSVPKHCRRIQELIIIHINIAHFDIKNEGLYLLGTTLENQFPKTSQQYIGCV